MKFTVLDFKLKLVIFVLISTLIIGCEKIGSKASTNKVSSSSVCSPDSLPRQQCLTSVDNLIPGQPNVGLHVITMEGGMLESFEKRCLNGTLKQNLLMRGSDYANPDFGGHRGVEAPQGISGVIAPNGKILLINGHHHAYALNLLKAEVKYNQLSGCDYNGYVYVYIRDNFYNKRYKEEDGSLDRANKYMIGVLEFESRVWLKNADYQKISYKDLPKRLLDMGDDPYRSLIKLVRDDKCNAGSKKHPNFKWQRIVNGDSILPFIEFSWGEKLRQLKLTELNYDPYKNLPYDYNPKVKFETESSIETFRKGQPFYIMNPKQCATYSIREKDIKRDENKIFRVNVRCKDMSTKMLREAYNYILQRYDSFKGLPGYNYNYLDRNYVCTGAGE